LDVSYCPIGYILVQTVDIYTYFVRTT